MCSFHCFWPSFLTSTDEVPDSSPAKVQKKKKKSLKRFSFPHISFPPSASGEHLQKKRAAGVRGRPGWGSCWTPRLDEAVSGAYTEGSCSHKTVLKWSVALYFCDPVVLHHPLPLPSLLSSKSLFVRKEESMKKQTKKTREIERSITLESSVPIPASRGWEVLVFKSPWFFFLVFGLFFFGFVIFFFELKKNK
jgi:hypothetical protein